VCSRLGRGVRGQPTLTRRRMRMLSLGALGLAVAIVLAGGAAPEDHPVAQLLVHLFALASGVLFLIGFAPPALLRRAWRRPEELRLGEAELGLMEAESSTDVAATLLPHVTSVVGGRGSVLLDGSGRPVSWHGLDADGARALGERTARGEAADPPDTALAVELRSGWLVTQASVYTPFFGRDETEMMHRLAVLADLALERADLLQQERRARAQLVEAQRIAHIGSWEWDADTGEVVWSDGMYAIYGVDPGQFEPVPSAVQDFVHPDDRPGLARAIEEALAQGRPFTYEYRLVGDEPKVVQARGQAVSHGDGGARMIGTVQDISERKRDEARRERFIANAAHELRTPLTTLLGFTDLLSRSRHLLPEDRVQTAFEAVDRAGKRLSVLVNNLLDLTKLQQGGVDVSSEPVAVGPLTERVLATTPAPNGARVDVRVDRDVVALADASRLDQIISNLLTNAFRYGGPEIVLEAEAGNGDVVVSVSDNGPGVEEELVPHLFDPFARGSSSAGVGGSGLGLAIVRTLAEAQRGEVWYERREPTGARFCVRLPAAP
jgi:signal transduction histidine kinase